MEGGPDTWGLASQKVADGGGGTSPEGAGFWGKGTLVSRAGPMG